MSAERLRRSDWLVDWISNHADAARLVRAWHYSKSTPNTSTYRHGLYRQPFELGDPWGVAMWIPPTRSAAEAIVGDDWMGVLSLSRLVVAPEVPPNGASFLLGGSMRLIDRERWPVLVTYADRALGHTGVIYKATNWRCDGDVPAGDVWIGPNGERRGRKRGRFSYKRDEMIALGFRRADAAPKVRYVHDVRPARVIDR